MTELPSFGPRFTPFERLGVGGVAATLGLALFGVFVLLPRWVAERGPARPPVANVMSEALFAEDEAGRAAGSLRRAVVEWAVLRERSVGRWAGQQSREVNALLVQAHNLFADGAVVAAEEAASEVLARIEDLRVEAGRVVAAAVTSGRVALAEGRPSAATERFLYAFEVEPGAPAARQGLERAAALDDALRAIERGASLERSGDLGGAEREYRRAHDLAPWFPEGGHALARLASGRRDATYAEIVSHALVALDGGRWQEAEAALGRAGVLRPNAPEVRDGLERLAVGRRSARLIELERMATRQEGEEAWAQAVATYEATLEIAPASLAAQRGRDRALAREELDRQLRGHLARADRLADPAVLADAARTLAQAAAIADRGPRLEGQIERLERQVRLMSTPVAVEIASDGETEVTVYRVGRLGRFERRVVEILPGTYTVVGTRRGFRDVRLILEVRAGGTPAALTVRCEESL